MRNKILFVASLLIIASMVLAACAQPTAEVIEKEVIKTVEVEKEVVKTVEVEKEVIQTVEVEKEVVEEEVTFNSADPKTFNDVLFGDLDTLDPAWNYETAGNGIIENVYDSLVAYKGADANSYVPKLATGWEILDNGATYVFTIREGVTFHEGQTLDVGDVAYSFQRGLLQGGGWSPQWLYTEAFFGTGIYDVACLIDDNECAYEDDRETLQTLDAETLMGICEQVTNAIVADEAAGTVTFYLSQPWAPMLATLAGTWGAIVDKDWAIEQGAWDGDCATWQNYYGVTSENTPLREVMNGTGPYKLDHWTPGEEVVLVANENYWQTEPLYEGGPSGVARLDRVVQIVGR
jgi:peptide/nickel transport system substrate-binding protein